MHMEDDKEVPIELSSLRKVRIVAEAEDFPVCWICLDGPEANRPLVHACRCPSWTHAECVARWQLQSAGTRRETHCDFCRERLPAWKDVLTPDGDTEGATAVMNVNFNSKTYSFTVSPGPDGYRQFTHAIRRAFRLPEDSELNITFTCDEPSSGSLLTLSGPGAFDAAVHCAAVSAKRRALLTSETSGGDGGGAGSAGGEHAQVAQRGPSPGCPCPARAQAASPTGSSSGASSGDGSGNGDATGLGSSATSPAGSSQGAASAGGEESAPAGRRGGSLARKLRSALAGVVMPIVRLG